MSASPLHPYIGLRAHKRAVGNRPRGPEGVVVAVGQCGSTHEDSCAFVGAYLLHDDGSHDEVDLAYLVVDHAEAMARLTPTPPTPGEE